MPRRLQNSIQLIVLLAFLLTGLALNTSAQQTLFTTQTPVLTGQNDGVSYELGMKFQSSVSGQLTAIRYWKDAQETGTHIGNIWSSGGTLLASVTFSNETASGWQQQALASALHITASTTYLVSVNSSFYVATVGPACNPYPCVNDSRESAGSQGLYFTISNGALTSVADDNNGVFATLGTFPAWSYHYANYFRDVVFTPEANSIPQPAGCLQKLVSVDGGNTFSAYTDLNNPALAQSGTPVEFKLVVTNCGNASVTPGTLDDCINADPNAVPFACAPKANGGLDGPGLVLYQPPTPAPTSTPLKPGASVAYSKTQLPNLLVSANDFANLCRTASTLTPPQTVVRNDAQFDGTDANWAPVSYESDAYVQCPGTPGPPTANCVVINAVQNVPITPVTLTGSGGCGAPYTFSAATGLPTGLTMSSTGTISGTPTVTGTFAYTFTVTDGCGHHSTVNCSVTVTPGLPACTIPGVTISNTSWNKFNIPAGSNPLVWVHAHIGKPSGVSITTKSTILFTGASLSLNGISYPLPDGLVTFDPAAPATITTSFDAVQSRWETLVNPNNLSDEMFFLGAAIPVSPAIAAGANATFTFTVLSQDPKLSFPWQWSAAVYTYWPTDWNQAQIQPFHSSYHAGTPLNTAVQKSLIQGPRGGGGSNFTGSWSATGTGSCPVK